MKNYTITDRSVLLDLDKLYCNNESQVLNSKAFYDMVVRFLKYLKKQDKIYYRAFRNIDAHTIVRFYKDLFVWNYQDVSQQFKDIPFLEDRIFMYRFTENFYEFWRRFERYAIFKYHTGYSNTTSAIALIEDSMHFESLILRLYRSFAQKIIYRSFPVYRQLSSGVSASLLIRPNNFTHKNFYPKLNKYQFIQSSLLNTPIMLYSHANIRTGVYREVFENPLDTLKINSDYFTYAIWVGNLLAYVYFHKSLMGHGISLGNLFEPARHEQYTGKKPDLICVFGAKDERFDGTYYKDTKNNLYIGTVSLNPKNDYFGYLKKMILTLHNLYMIDEGSLPIHGAMVQITFNNGKRKNVVIMGDSGAGKSETLEALRNIDADIDHMRIVYDDMGVFKFKGDKLISHGTETGAFVRLDDLEAGYAYQNLDRSIFLNPNKTNARVILPVTYYDFIIADHEIDLCLYANNYEDPKESIRLFNNVNVAIEVFTRGTRRAKGTTNEVGITETFFANPFGPLQRKEHCGKLIHDYFNHMFNKHIPIGEIYTRLSIDGMREKGPRMAAESLLKLLKE